jgi:hypothetical protein
VSFVDDNTIVVPKIYASNMPQMILCLKTRYPICHAATVLPNWHFANNTQAGRFGMLSVLPGGAMV